MEKRTLEQTANDSVQPSFDLLPEGNYCFAILSAEAATSKAGQGMLVMELAPCKEDGKSKTAVESKARRHYTMLADIQDEEAFAEDTRNKLAKKQECEPGAVSDVDVQARVAERMQDAWKKMRWTAEALFGRKEFPFAPRKNRETGEYLDEKGNIMDRTQVNNAWNERKNAEENACIDVVNGDKNVVGYVIYGTVSHGQYNGQPSVNINRVSDELRDGETLVPVAQWAN